MSFPKTVKELALFENGIRILLVEVARCDAREWLEKEITKRAAKNPGRKYEIVEQENPSGLGIMR